MIKNIIIKYKARKVQAYLKCKRTRLVSNINDNNNNNTRKFVHER